MRVFFFTSLLCAGCSLSGCAGQLQAAMLEHAKATQVVADTLSAASDAIQCQRTKDEAMCSTAVSTIRDQVKALQDSAGILERARP